MPINLVNPRPDSTNWSPILKQNFNDTEDAVNANESDIEDHDDEIGIIEDTLVDHASDIDDNATDILQNESDIAENRGYLGYHDRGDPAGVDFATGDLTTDGTWRALDCSGVVPEFATAIQFTLIVKDDLVGKSFSLEKYGNSNHTNTLPVYTLVANQYIIQNGVVACDGDRKCQYYGDNTAFTNIFIIIAGWYMAE